MAYKGRLVEFSKKLGIKSIKILKKIRDASRLARQPIVTLPSPRMPGDGLVMVG